jgi:2-iminobutanoate/2-iminopropanoate deaminase
MIMTTRVLEPGAAAGRPYVPGIVAGGTLVFVSGQIPLRDGRLVDGPIEAQAEAVLENIEQILQAAGASLRDVVRCGVYLADLGDLPRFNAAYERAFDGWLPTRTTVGVTLPGYDVEIDCIAVIPAGTSEGP